MIGAREVFGSPQQQALLKRGQALYELLADRPEATYYGRTVGVLTPTGEGRALLETLIALQGASNFFAVPNQDIAALKDELDAAGYGTTHYASWTGSETALAAAEAILAKHRLPDDITVTIIDQTTPKEGLEGLAQVSLGAGVLPVNGAVLRGASKPGLGVVATDAEGRPVSCAAAASFAHAESPYARMAWWGMLATDPSRRGERLALILGAHAIREMHRRFGYSAFFTGVQPGNAPSEAVSAKCGLHQSDTAILTVADPAAVAGGQLTK